MNVNFDRYKKECEVMSLWYLPDFNTLTFRFRNISNVTYAYIWKYTHGPDHVDTFEKLEKDCYEKWPDKMILMDYDGICKPDQRVIIVSISYPCKIRYNNKLYNLYYNLENCSEFSKLDGVLSVKYICYPLRMINPKSIDINSNGDLCCTTDYYTAYIIKVPNKIMNINVGQGPIIVCDDEHLVGYLCER